MDRLHSDVGRVRTRLELAEFVQAMAAVARSPGVREWENDTLPRFLESLSGWISDMDGYFLNQGLREPPQPSWSLIADMLLAATLYE